ncbi:50S ribosomal protein L24 [Candidatus Collierbacteria bacterium CG17_big_fil_post_rev_8_21_14_2_50_45_7]|uniref:Large ribosomal subunit protein uL24 n=2 Tax=Candidatus Collieribacteriota TaxID=1752725 RepID=A0A2H0WZ06_9BACT|nr:MAG: 50S ribosomal protein L24 [Candidatus Collierbacteria bacterium CG09_land_8_20_14_0_10_46_12]PIW07654.1 MAG: 50S ribosomal protein L24 [Candidatus Collierbacteria bacterium CG17_big_fil_post_rev_8_21_14_2_50_45_7]
MKKFKKGDIVLVTAGKDKGKIGEITKVLPKSDAVVVKGANMYKKHVKPTQNTEGGMVSRERPLSTGKISHVQDGKQLRFAQRKKL